MFYKVNSRHEVDFPKCHSTTPVPEKQNWDSWVQGGWQWVEPLTENQRVDYGRGHQRGHSPEIRSYQLRAKPGEPPGESADLDTESMITGSAATLGWRTGGIVMLLCITQVVLPV